MVFEYYLGSNTLTRIASIRLPNNGRIYEYQTNKNFHSNYSPKLSCCNNFFLTFPLFKTETKIVKPI